MSTGYGRSCSLLAARAWYLSSFCLFFSPNTAQRECANWPSGLDGAENRHECLVCHEIARRMPPLVLAWHRICSCISADPKDVGLPIALSGEVLTSSLLNRCVVLHPQGYKRGTRQEPPESYRSKGAACR